MRAAVRFVQVMAVCRMDGWILFGLWAPPELGTEKAYQTNVIAGFLQTIQFWKMQYHFSFFFFLYCSKNRHML